MSLLFYEKALADLNPNRTGSEPSPHKVAMMLAVMDLIAEQRIKQNKIEFNQSLIDAFTVQFEQLKGPKDRNNPHLPFFHLRSSGFWRHHIRPGKRLDYEALSTVSGPGQLRDCITYASLDDELFELLNNSVAREYLKTPLGTNLKITAEIRKEGLKPERGGWDWLECEACVESYIDMLQQELLSNPYSKAEYRRELQHQLNGRSEGSIEYKYQNISAVLIEMGFPYISGYKPAFNYQQQLKDVVLSFLAANKGVLGDIDSADVQYAPMTEQLFDWDQVIDDELPERIPVIERPERRFLVRRVNFTEREARNKQLGLQAEEFVLGVEKRRLIEAGRKDLADEVQWSSHDEGDGLGYDIRSFKFLEEQPIEEEHFIEVKATASGKYQPFFITDNEVAYSKAYANSYSLYRVYNFHKQRRLFALPGAVDQHVRLQAKLYHASLEVETSE